MDGDVEEESVLQQIKPGASTQQTSQNSQLRAKEQNDGNMTSDSQALLSKNVGTHHPSRTPSKSQHDFQSSKSSPCRENSLDGRLLRSEQTQKEYHGPRKVEGSGPKGSEYGSRSPTLRLMNVNNMTSKSSANYTNELDEGPQQIQSNVAGCTTEQTTHSSFNQIKHKKNFVISALDSIKITPKSLVQQKQVGYNVSSSRITFDSHANISDGTKGILVARGDGINESETHRRSVHFGGFRKSTCEVQISPLHPSQQTKPPIHRKSKSFSRIKGYIQRHIIAPFKNLDSLDQIVIGAANKNSITSRSYDIERKGRSAVQEFEVSPLETHQKEPLLSPQKQLGVQQPDNLKSRQQQMQNIDEEQISNKSPCVGNILSIKQVSSTGKSGIESYRKSIKFTQQPKQADSSLLQNPTYKCSGQVVSSISSNSPMANQDRHDLFQASERIGNISDFQIKSRQLNSQNEMQSNDTPIGIRLSAQYYQQQFEEGYESEDDIYDDIYSSGQPEQKQSPEMHYHISGGQHGNLNNKEEELLNPHAQSPIAHFEDQNEEQQLSISDSNECENQQQTANIYNNMHQINQNNNQNHIVQNNNSYNQLNLLTQTDKKQEFLIDQQVDENLEGGAQQVDESQQNEQTQHEIQGNKEQETTLNKLVQQNQYSMHQLSLEIDKIEENAEAEDDSKEKSPVDQTILQNVPQKTIISTFQEVSGIVNSKMDQDLRNNDEKIDIKDSSTDDQKVLNRIREESGKETEQLIEISDKQEVEESKTDDQLLQNINHNNLILRSQKSNSNDILPELVPEQIAQNVTIKKKYTPSHKGSSMADSEDNASKGPSVNLSDKMTFQGSQVHSNWQKGNTRGKDKYFKRKKVLQCANTQSNLLSTNTPKNSSHNGDQEHQTKTQNNMAQISKETKPLGQEQSLQNILKQLNDMQSIEINESVEKNKRRQDSSTMIDEMHSSGFNKDQDSRILPRTINSRFTINQNQQQKMNHSSMMIQFQHLTEYEQDRSACPDDQEDNDTMYQQRKHGFKMNSRMVQWQSPTRNRDQKLSRSFEQQHDKRDMSLCDDDQNNTEKPKSKYDNYSNIHKSKNQDNQLKFVRVVTKNKEINSPLQKSSVASNHDYMSHSFPNFINSVTIERNDIMHASIHENKTQFKNTPILHQQQQPLHKDAVSSNRGSKNADKSKVKQLTPDNEEGFAQEIQQMVIIKQSTNIPDSQHQDVLNKKSAKISMISTGNSQNKYQDDIHQQEQILIQSMAQPNDFKEAVQFFENNPISVNLNQVVPNQDSQQAANSNNQRADIQLSPVPMLQDVLNNIKDDDLSDDDQQDEYSDGLNNTSSVHQSSDEAQMHQIVENSSQMINDNGQGDSQQLQVHITRKKKLKRLRKKPITRRQRSISDNFIEVLQMDKQNKRREFENDVKEKSIDENARTASNKIKNLSNPEINAHKSEIIVYKNYGNHINRDQERDQTQKQFRVQQNKQEIVNQSNQPDQQQEIQVNLDEKNSTQEKVSDGIDSVSQNIRNSSKIRKIRSQHAMWLWDEQNYNVYTTQRKIDAHHEVPQEDELDKAMTDVNDQQVVQCHKSNSETYDIGSAVKYKEDKHHQDIYQNKLFQEDNQQHHQMETNFDQQRQSLNQQQNIIDYSTQMRDDSLSQNQNEATGQLSKEENEPDAKVEQQYQPNQADTVNSEKKQQVLSADCNDENYIDEEQPNQSNDGTENNKDADKDYIQKVQSSIESGDDGEGDMEDQDAKSFQDNKEELQQDANNQEDAPVSIQDNPYLDLLNQQDQSTKKQEDSNGTEEHPEDANQNQIQSEGLKISSQAYDEKADSNSRSLSNNEEEEEDDQFQQPKQNASPQRISGGLDNMQQLRIQEQKSQHEQQINVNSTSRPIERSSANQNKFGNLSSSDEYEEQHKDGEVDQVQDYKETPRNSLQEELNDDQQIDKQIEDQTSHKDLQNVQVDKEKKQNSENENNDNHISDQNDNQAMAQLQVLNQSNYQNKIVDIQQIGAIIELQHTEDVEQSVLNPSAVMQPQTELQFKNQNQFNIITLNQNLQDNNNFPVVLSSSGADQEQQAVQLLLIHHQQSSKTQQIQPHVTSNSEDHRTEQNICSDITQVIENASGEGLMNLKQVQIHNQVDATQIYQNEQVNLQRSDQNNIPQLNDVKNEYQRMQRFQSLETKEKSKNSSEEQPQPLSVPTNAQISLNGVTLHMNHSEAEKNLQDTTYRKFQQKQFENSTPDQKQPHPQSRSVQITTTEHDRRFISSENEDSTIIMSTQPNKNNLRKNMQERQERFQSTTGHSVNQDLLQPQVLLDQQQQQQHPKSQKYGNSFHEHLFDFKQKCQFINAPANDNSTIHSIPIQNMQQLRRKSYQSSNDKPNTPILINEVARSQKFPDDLPFRQVLVSRNDFDTHNQSPRLWMHELNKEKTHSRNETMGGTRKFTISRHANQCNEYGGNVEPENQITLHSEQTTQAVQQQQQHQIMDHLNLQDMKQISQIQSEQHKKSTSSPKNSNMNYSGNNEQQNISFSFMDSYTNSYLNRQDHRHHQRLMQQQYGQQQFIANIQNSPNSTLGRNHRQQHPVEFDRHQILNQNKYPFQQNRQFKIIDGKPSQYMQGSHQQEHKNFNKYQNESHHRGQTWLQGNTYPNNSNWHQDKINEHHGHFYGDGSSHGPKQPSINSHKSHQEMISYKSQCKQQDQTIQELGEAQAHATRLNENQVYDVDSIRQQEDYSSLQFPSSNLLRLQRKMGATQQSTLFSDDHLMNEQLNYHKQQLIIDQQMMQLENMRFQHQKKLFDRNADMYRQQLEFQSLDIQTKLLQLQQLQMYGQSQNVNHGRDNFMGMITQQTRHSPNINTDLQMDHLDSIHNMASLDSPLFNFRIPSSNQLDSNLGNQGLVNNSRIYQHIARQDRIVREQQKMIAQLQATVQSQPAHQNHQQQQSKGDQNNRIQNQSQQQQHQLYRQQSQQIQHGSQYTQNQHQQKQHTVPAGLGSRGVVANNQSYLESDCLTGASVQIHPATINLHHGKINNNQQVTAGTAIMMHHNNTQQSLSPISHSINKDQHSPSFIPPVDTPNDSIQYIRSTSNLAQSVHHQSLHNLPPNLTTATPNPIIQSPNRHVDTTTSTMPHAHHFSVDTSGLHPQSHFLHHHEQGHALQSHNLSQFAQNPLNSKMSALSRSDTQMTHHSQNQQHINYNNQGPTGASQQVQVLQNQQFSLGQGDQNAPGVSDEKIHGQYQIKAVSVDSLVGTDRVLKPEYIQQNVQQNQLANQTQIKHSQEINRNPALLPRDNQQISLQLQTNPPYSQLQQATPKDNPILQTVHQTQVIKNNNQSKIGNQMPSQVNRRLIVRHPDAQTIQSKSQLINIQGQASFRPQIISVNPVFSTETSLINESPTYFHETQQQAQVKRASHNLVQTQGNIMGSNNRVTRQSVQSHEQDILLGQHPLQQTNGSNNLFINTNSATLQHHQPSQQQIASIDKVDTDNDNIQVPMQYFKTPNQLPNQHTQISQRNNHGDEMHLTGPMDTRQFLMLSAEKDDVLASYGASTQYLPSQPYNSGLPPHPHLHHHNHAHLNSQLQTAAAPNQTPNSQQPPQSLTSTHHFSQLHLQLPALSKMQATTQQPTVSPKQLSPHFAADYSKNSAHILHENSHSHQRIDSACQDAARDQGAHEQVSTNQRFGGEFAATDHRVQQADNGAALDDYGQAQGYVQEVIQQPVVQRPVSGAAIEGNGRLSS